MSVGHLLIFYDIRSNWKKVPSKLSNFNLTGLQEKEVTRVVPHSNIFTLLPNTSIRKPSVIFKVFKKIAKNSSQKCLVLYVVNLSVILPRIQSFVFESRKNLSSCNVNKFCPYFVCSSEKHGNLLTLKTRIHLPPVPQKNLRRFHPQRNKLRNLARSRRWTSNMK